MAKFDMTQLEKATTIPNGSLYLVEMGDGSGTKTVTQETLAEETGKALKIGDLAELQTENKENLVKAINEAAQSGGGGTDVDILDSKEEIEANTEPEKAAGALAVKEMFTELNDNLISNIYVGDDGKLHKVQGGADSVLPFSKMSGTLQIGFSFKATMNKNDSGIGGGSGTITILFTNGEIANRTITGSGSAGTVSAQGVAHGCTISNFTITSVKWIPD